MTTADKTDGSVRLSEEAAHRLLARAVELDDRYGHEVPVAQLREIATEAGIAPQAFERALAELRSVSTMPPHEELPSSRPGILKRMWQRLLGRGGDEPHAERFWESVVTNSVAFAAFWALVSLADSVRDTLNVEWAVQFALVLIANLIGVGLSLRLRARVTAVVLGVTAAAQLAEFLMQLRYGVQSIQGGAVHWALMLASLLGIGFGVLLIRKHEPPPPDIAGLAPIADTAVDADAARQATSTGDPRRLLLRLA